jgi:hypothetical protein
MRKYQPPTESLISNPQWLATMNFVESTLYPMSDPILARNEGTLSNINYRTVYETVFFGNDRIQGLYSQVVAPTDAPQILQPDTDQIVETLETAIENFSLSDAAKGVAQGLLLEAKTTGRDIENVLSKVGVTSQLTAKDIADVGIKILEPLGWTPAKRNSFKNFVSKTFKSISEQGVQPGAKTSVAPSVTPTTTPAPVGEPTPTTTPTPVGESTPETSSDRLPTGRSVRGRPPSTSAFNIRRVTELANSLVPLVQHQTFEDVPLGYSSEDFRRVPRPELTKLLKQENDLLAKSNLLPEGSPERAAEVEKLALVQEQILEFENRGEGYIFESIPGRGPTSAADRELIDLSRRLLADPRKFTPEAIELDLKTIEEMRQRTDILFEPENFLYAKDVGPTLRQYQREGKLPDFYQKLSQVMPSWNFKNVLDVNGIDDYTEGKVQEFAASAQRRELTIDQYLQELLNDPEHVSRVQKIRGDSEPRRPAIRLPSDDDLTSVFKYVSQATIGRTLPKEVYQNMINAYKPQLVQFQQQLQGGGTVTEPPQAETFAESQIEQQFGQEAFTYKMGGFLDRLSQIGGSGR